MKFKCCWNFIWLLLISELVVGERGNNFETDIENFLSQRQPQSEIVQIGTNNGIEQWLRQPQLMQGMDPTAVEELLRTKKPVVRVSTDSEQNKVTTTYTLSEDGGIRKQTLTEKKPVVRTFSTISTGNSGAWPNWASSDSEMPSTQSRRVFHTRIGESFNEPGIQLPTSWDPQAWPRRTFHTIGTSTTSTTTHRPMIEPKNLPNLDELVRGLYDTTTKNPDHTESTTSATSSGTPITTVNVYDLPITSVWPHEQLSPELRQTALAAGQPSSESSVRLYSNTVRTHALPTASDLDPNMRGILSRAGIDPDEIRNSQTNTITRSRTEPDGRVITTTYRVNPISSPQLPTQMVNLSNQSNNNGFHYQPESQIANYLVKIGLSLDFLKSRNGEYETTIIDDDGNVLTATYKLSSLIDDKKDENMPRKPIK